MQIRCVLHPTSQQRSGTKEGDGHGILPPPHFCREGRLKFKERIEGRTFICPPSQAYNGPLSRNQRAICSPGPPEYLWIYKRRWRRGGARRYLGCVSNAPLAPPKPKGWAGISYVRIEVAGNDPNCEFRENNGLAEQISLDTMFKCSSVHAQGPPSARRRGLPRGEV